MTEGPQTRFVRNGDVHLAYQIVGTGPIDLLLIDTWAHHVDLVWDIPDFARLLRRLSSFARLIQFDRRGKSAPSGWTRVDVFATTGPSDGPLSDRSSRCTLGRRAQLRDPASS